MKFSTKGRYGLRLMLDIALHCNEGSVVLKDISKRQELSGKYLWHMINPLKSAGLIQSIRGPKGGYVLAKPPSEITLKEIVRFLEGPLSIVECTEKPSVCSRANSCVARDVWKEVADKISQTLESIMLKDIVERYNNKTGSADGYSI